MSPILLKSMSAFFVVYLIKVVFLFFDKDKAVRFCELWLAGVCLVVIFNLIRVFPYLG